MFRSGYLSLGRIRGAALRAHWSILLGAIVFGGFRFDPWFLLGFVLLVLVHELGHACLVWRFGHRVQAIEVTGLGGVCRWDGNATPFEQAAIAWGGVLAQGALLGAAYAWSVWAGPAVGAAERTLLGVFVRTNLWLIAVNLLPIPPLDGSRAWQIFSVWRERRRGGVPYGSWIDATPNAQRAWLDKLERTRQPRKHEVEAPVDPLDIPADARPTRAAERAIEELLQRTRRKAEEKDD